MVVRGLALTTELALMATAGRVTDRGEYIVIERPDAPGWTHGNFLALPRAPGAADLERWIETFARELGRERVVALRWDDPSGDDDAERALSAAGFVLDPNVVLVADDVLAPPHEMAMRPLSADEVLQTAVLAWNLADRHDESYRQFLHGRVAWQSELVERGLASFWGAFDAGKLVASCGLVRLGQLGRYQDVQTLPAYRRRGLAGALLVAAAAEARAAHVERLVLFAEPGGAATRVYERVGFRQVETTTLARRPRGSGAISAGSSRSRS